MAGTTRNHLTTHKPNGDVAFHHKCCKAVLTGLYAAHGTQILFAKPADYQKVLRSFSRIAIDQADEMVRRLA